MAKIVFENPNSAEDTARYLPKLLAAVILSKLKAERENRLAVAGQA